ncbi:MAG TPA: hypothetical protein VGQ57_09255 [Polyangiaceae bacterium]|jgi:hypothetical protein|nr:hypothetical protein [Polyangiaceae bacterium]
MAIVVEQMDVQPAPAAATSPPRSGDPPQPASGDAPPSPTRSAEVRRILTALHERHDRLRAH